MNRDRETNHHEYWWLYSAILLEDQPAPTVNGKTFAELMDEVIEQMRRGEFSRDW